MSDIFVVGHKNPDTDSVVSAMAYAALRNALGHREYVATHLDHISDETKRMLEHFGFEEPLRIRNVKNQIKDLDYDTPPALNASVTLDRAWQVMKDLETPVLPVINEDGSLYGTLSSSDITSYTLSTINEPRVQDIPLFNLLSVLEGKLLNDGFDCPNMLSGTVTVAVPQENENLLFADEDSIVIVGNQPDMIKRAIEKNVNAVIVCQSTVDSEIYKAAERTCVITTPFDAGRALKLIYQAVPISRACFTGHIETFKLTDYVDDVREAVSKSRFRCYPIVDETGRVVGTVARFHLLKPRRKKVVLVDHNESAQAVSGLEEAEIMEIIDHHRLADIETGQPIAVRNEPVGSTTTIVTAMYQEKGVMPSAKMAGLMCAAILSDTVSFKSPTCTKRDIAMAERLSKIANISLEELGKELFDTNAVNAKPTDELIKSDFKEFHIAEQFFGVGQLTCVDSLSLLSRKDEFMEALKVLKKQKGYNFVMMMLTDVLKEGSQIIYVGHDDIIKFAFSVELDDGTVFLPGVMSRKKQIIPMLTALWG